VTKPTLGNNDRVFCGDRGATANSGACRADVIRLKEHIEPYADELPQEEPDGELLAPLRAIVRDGWLAG